MDDPFEWLYVFNPDEQQIARFRGTPDEVDLSDELKSRTGGLYGHSVLKDHLLAHNHPARAGGFNAVASFPPSLADLVLAVECDLNEFVIVSGGWRYAVRRPGDHWPTDEHGLLRIVVDRQMELVRELGTVEAGEAAAVARLHIVLDHLGKEGWIDYEAVAFPRRM